ncbi:GspK family T2SS minor pseudopilin variant XcpX [Cocleimonas flava]|uniref:Type II secretory pathway component PulK n=1 Tax=Cocleimonas flava TaxID=634765 RepID=A0A4R1ENJ1_9GAMM|nr:type II secretion system minor pseudopilin GspK [Cocleimonas flava]TCJ82816.1 type II secretory pathway component PulK [Cocleimonas flava]
MPKQQKGIALITAMIITSIAVSLAGMIMYRQQIQIRLSSNIGHFEQAYLYANGMEDWAGTILDQSFEDHPDYDSLTDDWYTETGIVLPITGGIMQGKLYDLQARINLNSLNRPKSLNKTSSTSSNSSTTTNASLVAGNENTDTNNEEQENTEDKDENNEKYYYPAETARQRLINLMTIEVDPEQELGPPENFTDILKDWIDSDQDNGNKEQGANGSGNGAESPYYQTLEPAYFSADTTMISLTELRLLKEMKEGIYKKLARYTTTLPIVDNANKTTSTPININTAEKPVLLAIGLTPDKADELIELVKETPFENINDFLESSIVSNDIKTESNPDGAVDTDQLDVKTNFFYLEGRVEINNTRIFINSILERKNGKVSVIMRDFSNPQSITKVIN